MPSYNETLTDTTSVDSSPLNGTTNFKNTLTDSSSIVSTPLSGGVLYKNTISNIIDLISILPLSHPIITLNNNISINQNITLSHVTTLLEEFILTVSQVDTTISKEIVLDILNILESINILFKLTVTSPIVLNESISSYLKNLIEIYNSISINSSISSKFNIINSIIETISVLEELERAFVASISEVLVINETINSLFKVFNTLLDSIVLLDSPEHSRLFLVSLLDSIETDDTYSTRLVGKNVLNNYFIIKLPEILNGGTYLAYTFSPETKGITTYSNYNFTKATKFNNKYLFSNPVGLYEYGAITDDGSLITSYIQTAGLTFGTSDKKSVPSIYLGYSSDGTSILKVSPDGIGSFYYKLNKYSNNLDTKKIDIGKGLEGRYFQFEIITDASHFDLESIEFLPMIIRRKL